MSHIVQRYDRNPRGSDFVVGDIHGCFDQLRQALNAVDFVPETDRLFSVGDLIDRGPQSTETLDWLAKPWFHACIGNHEDMALQSLYGDNALLGWVMLNGGGWWMTLDSETRMKYLSAFRQLPTVMEIEITYDRNIHRYANVWFIDTGAFLSGEEHGHLSLLTLESLFKDGDSTAVNRYQIP